MIRSKTPGQSTKASRSTCRAPGTRLLAGLALLAAIACGSGGWRCEVTIVMDGQTVVGTGSANTEDAALATARLNACNQLGLDDLGVRTCEQGLKPSTADSWSLTESCEET